MENRQDFPLVEEMLEFSALSKNSKIAQIFDLCFQPKTEEDLDNILLDFWERIKSLRHSEYFSILDYVYIYALDYVYMHDTVSVCSVSRTLYLFQMIDQLVSDGENRDLTESEYEKLFNTLQKFTNLYEDKENEDMLVQFSVNSILSGNLGISFYLHKFRLINFPSEINKQSKEIFDILVSNFNSFLTPDDENVEVDDMENSVQLHEFLNKVTEKEVNIRRSILTFFILTTVAEYKMCEKLEVDMNDLQFYTDHKKESCLRKLMIINTYIDATMQLHLTFKEIEEFTEVFLNPFITAEVGRSLVETCKKLLAYPDIYYKLRSLKDLARLKVRSMFLKSITIPEQVNELDIPVTLKELLNFRGEGIWDELLENHINKFLDLAFNRVTDEIEDEEGQGIGDGNVRQVGDGNVRQVGDESELEY